MAEPAEAVTARVGALAEELRRRGARIGIGEMLGAHRALAAIDASSREQAFYALRTTLCSTRVDLAGFDAAFAAAFGPNKPLVTTRTARAPEPIVRPARVDALVSQPAGSASDEDGDPAPAAWSDIELLRRKDFAHYTDDERAAARRLLVHLANRAPRQRSRRKRPVRGRGTTHDLRNTARASLRHGGELLELRWRDYGERPRRLVLVCDVSGSMAAYARMLLQYVQACVAAQARVEAFAFGTRLTRLTHELRGGRDPDHAIARAIEQLSDWSGGTRIGTAIAELNREHGRRIGRGAVVVILSDGWDRGDPAELAAEMARLRRCAHRVVWLNPLSADPRYEPLTRGMQAALPMVHRLLPGNSIASLEELAGLFEAGPIHAAVA